MAMLLVTNEAGNFSRSKFIFSYKFTPENNQRKTDIYIYSDPTFFIRKKVNSHGKSRKGLDIYTQGLVAIISEDRTICDFIFLLKNYFYFPQ